LFYNKFKAR